MKMQKEATTTREFEATEIPSGMKIRIPEGTPLAITQSLGGSYTVLTPYGYMARVDGSDADAIGEEIASPDGAASGKTPGELAWDQLRTCYDPEIPVNIVDLGLIYDIAIKPARVDIKMTLTALGCPMAADVMADVRDHLLTLPGVEDAGVDIVYEPVWTPERMSEEARWELGMV